MKKEQKYHELLDKLAEAIKKGKGSDVIERIKDRIEEIEHQIYLKKLKEKNKDGKQ